MEGCIPCITTQRPALQSLSAEVGDQVQLIEVDVVARPDLAESWRVLSVPTTVILDRGRRACKSIMAWLWRINCWSNWNGLEVWVLLR